MMVSVSLLACKLQTPRQQLCAFSCLHLLHAPSSHLAQAVSIVPVMDAQPVVLQAFAGLADCQGQSVLLCAQQYIAQQTS